MTEYDRIASEITGMIQKVFVDNPLDNLVIKNEVIEQNKTYSLAAIARIDEVTLREVKGWVSKVIEEFDSSKKVIVYSLPEWELNDHCPHVVFTNPFPCIVYFYYNPLSFFYEISLKVFCRIDKTYTFNATIKSSAS